MILPDELLPAAQHYTLLAIATALYAAAVVMNKERPMSRALWTSISVMGCIPIFHMLIAVFAAMTIPISSTDVSLVLHGVAVAAVLPVALCMADIARVNRPKKPKLEPTVGT